MGQISPAAPKDRISPAAPEGRISSLWARARESDVQADAAFRGRRIETAGLTSEKEGAEGMFERDERRTERSWTVEGGRGRKEQTRIRGEEG